ncbi:M15 family metallopeptidase [Ruegeria jejuensis]|uniref:M15 family metallopeptidase n=1 Tax=Ruegeria jejuensis TaxID=3233338 RepID=UPI00355C0E35
MDITELKPIPIHREQRDARGYHDIGFDGSDPRAMEALVDIGSHGVEVVPYYYLSDGSNPPYGRRIDGSLPNMLCRESLVPMLQEANEALAKSGCELVVYDAYRPVSTQRGLWNWALEKVATDHPRLSTSELEALTSQYSSDPRRFDPVDPTTWPTHSTGASIDVVLRSRDTGDLLDMGAAFDDLSVVAHTDHLERDLLAGRAAPDNPALANRRLLYWAMTDAGFVNYPAEYWHFDFGNQMYIHNTRPKNTPTGPAWYGYCQPLG